MKYQPDSGLPRLENAGIDAWLVRLFNTIDEANMAWITALVEACEQALGDNLVDIVPSYTTVLVHYNPLTLDSRQVADLLTSLLGGLTANDTGSDASIKELPVWYDPSVGPELALLQQHTGFSLERIIQLHSEHRYRVFALGFAPGFAFMGSLPAELELPRLSTPRKRVPAGSVALAGRQTSAYPQVSPGGWNLIGRTPARLFDPTSQALSLLNVGDTVRFVPVDKNEFIRLGGDTTPTELLL